MAQSKGKAASQGKRTKASAKGRSLKDLGVRDDKKVKGGFTAVPSPTTPKIPRLPGAPSIPCI
jgi:hypothetical protein